jgi:hypothetical protein
MGDRHMNKWFAAAIFGAGALVGATIVGYISYVPSIGPLHLEPWALPDFYYGDYGDERIDITGTVMGTDALPVNTWNVDCLKSENTCKVVYVNEIGRRQLGEIRTADWPIVSWTPTTIVTQDEVGPSTECFRNTITIKRPTKTVGYSSVPIPENQNLDFCKRFRQTFHLGPARREDWRIGNPKQPWER